MVREVLRTPRKLQSIGFFIKEYFQPQPATGRLEFQPATGNRQPALNFQPQPATATGTAIGWKIFISHFCLCCPAGAFFENKRLVVFVCVALRAASILKNRVFFVFY